MRALQRLSHIYRSKILLSYSELKLTQLYFNCVIKRENTEIVTSWKVQYSMKTRWPSLSLYYYNNEMLSVLMKSRKYYWADLTEVLHD